jgi:hypothetical protein
LNYSITKNGVELSKDLYTIDLKNKTLSTEESGLVLDFTGLNSWSFKTVSNCQFKTGSNCIFNTGSNCQFKTGSNCIFNTGSNCIFNTESCCTFDTGSCCTFKTIHHCTFNTLSDCTFSTLSNCTFSVFNNCIIKCGNSCVILFRDIKKTIVIPEEDVNQYYDSSKEVIKLESTSDLILNSKSKFDLVRDYCKRMLNYN